MKTTIKMFAAPKRVAALLAAFCLSLPCAALCEATPPVTLLLKFTPGQVTRTKVTTDFNYTLSGLPGSAASMALKNHTTQTLSTTVQKVAADGSATLLLHQDGLDTTFSMNGQPQPVPADQTAAHDLMTLVMTPTGKVVSSQALSTAAAANPMQAVDMSKISQLQGVLELPTAPISVGDTWKGNAAFDKILSGTSASGMNANMVVQSTLTSLSPAGIAVINQTLTGTFGGDVTTAGQSMQIQGTLTGAGTHAFDNAAGQDTGYTGDYALNMKITMAQMGPLTMQGQMTVRRDLLPAK